MRAVFAVALAAIAVSAAPNAQPSAASTGCTDKCKGYTTWMSSCAGQEPSGSGWPSACTEYCTSGSKRKEYTDCTQCMATSGLGGGDNGSLDRLCNQLVALSKISPSATAAAAEKAKQSSKDGKDSGARTNVAAVGAVAAAAAGALLF